MFLVVDGVVFDFDVVVDGDEFEDADAVGLVEGDVVGLFEVEADTVEQF